MIRKIRSRSEPFEKFAEKCRIAGKGRTFYENWHTTIMLVRFSDKALLPKIPGMHMGKRHQW
jgi:hypothetical protein